MSNVPLDEVVSPFTGHMEVQQTLIVEELEKVNDNVVGPVLQGRPRISCSLRCWPVFWAHCRFRRISVQSATFHGILVSCGSCCGRCVGWIMVRRRRHAVWLVVVMSLSADPLKCQGCNCVCRHVRLHLDLRVSHHLFFRHGAQRLSSGNTRRNG